MSRANRRTARGSAPVARARLEKLLDYDRKLLDGDLVGVLREEICALVRRHAAIDTDNVHFAEVRGSSTASTTLTVDIEVPSTGRPKRYCA